MPLFERAELQPFDPALEVAITIEPRDYRYCAEKVRNGRYNLEQNKLQTLFAAGEAASGPVLRGRGRGPGLDALMRKRGFPMATESPAAGE